MNENKNIVNFSVEPITEFTQLSSIISKARVRIFYTGLNRNLTYITEEFAEKLLSTLPYTPVGGLWSDEEEDFSDHGGKSDKDREKFQAFGVVPENPNFGWEMHTDKDGVLRRYACCDVYLWTARYEAARQIPKKAQSMELYIKSVKGDWKRDGSLEYFEFTDGQFFGLTALGEGVEPCFEGAAFYGLQDNASATEFFTELKKYTLSTENQLIGGTEKMENNVISPETVEEQVTETTETVATEEPIVENTVEEPVEEVTEEVTEEPTTEEPVEEVTEEPATEEPEEEPVVEHTTEEPEEEPVEEPVAEEPATEPVEETVSKSEYEALVRKNEELQAQVEELSSYKASIENAEKDAAIEKFASLLSEEDVAQLNAEKANYSISEFKKEISVLVLKNQEEVLFSKNETADAVVIEETTNYSGAARLMQKHCKD
jgi:hypothetical protein